MSRKNSFQLGAMYWLNSNYGKAEIERDMLRIKENNFNVIRAFIWWEQVERNKEAFDFRMHDILFEAAARYEIKIMETLGLYLPVWLIRELAEKGIDDSDRRYPCFDRPEVMQPMQRFIEQVVKRYKDAPALSIWNLWNEPCKIPCKCIHTIAKFTDWLRTRYANTRQLHAAWRGEYQVFETHCPENLEELNIEWVQTAFRYGAARGRITPIEYDFMEFATDNLTDNLQWLSSVVRKIDPVHEHHANPALPTQNGCNLGNDEWKMAKTLDSVSVSVHPSHFFFDIEGEEIDNFPTAYSFCVEQVRSWADGKNAWIGELQAGTTCHHLHKYTPTANDIHHYVWQAVGRGMSGLLFWLWQGWRGSMMEAGEFGMRRPHDGGATERSEAAAEVGAVLRENEALFSQLKRPASQVAIVVSMKTKFFKSLQRQSKPSCRKIDCEHGFAVYGCFKALERANIATDFITESQILEGKLAEYKAVFLPQVEVIGNKVAEKLGEYVSNGGWLWADGRCAFLDEHIYLRQKSPGHDLHKVFGCREADFVALRKDDEFTLVDGNRLVPHLFKQYLEPAGGEVRGLCHGHLVIVRNRFGKGVAVLNGTCLTLGLQKTNETGNMDYLASFAKEAGAAPRIETVPAHGFEVCVLNSSGTDLIVATNRSGMENTLEIKAPKEYTVVSCPQSNEEAISWDGKNIKRNFKDFETAVFVCRTV